MNQDFTEKKGLFVWKKKFWQRVSTEKKNRAQVVSKKTNSCNLKIPLPPHHFSNGPSLIYGFSRRVVRSGKDSSILHARVANHSAGDLPRSWS